MYINTEEYHTAAAMALIHYCTISVSCHHNISVIYLHWSLKQLLQDAPGSYFILMAALFCQLNLRKLLLSQFSFLDAQATYIL